MIFCICNNISEAHLRSMAMDLSEDPERIAEALGLYNEECCGRCLNDLPDMLPLNGRR